METQSKVCHKCKQPITGGYYQYNPEDPNTRFHFECFNRYEHYYGLDKPID